MSSSQVGRSSSRPTTWPAGEHPGAGVALDQAGLEHRGGVGGQHHLRPAGSLPFFIERPSASDLAPGHPASPLELQRPPARWAPARLSRLLLLDLLDEVGAQHPVRHPVDLGGDDGAVEAVGQVEPLHGSRHRGVLGQQETGAHADAGRAVRQRRGEAAPVEEATRRDHRDVDRVEHAGQEQRGRAPGRCGRRPRRPGP